MNRYGARGRGAGDEGALGATVFGKLSDLDRVSRGKMVRVAEATALPAPSQPFFQPIEGQPIGVLQVTQVDPQQISLITVQIDRERIAEAGNCDLRCRIRWGVGGARDFLECDWADGGLISLIADELWVDAVPYRPQAASGFDAAGFQRLITACVGIGSTDAIPPQFTESQVRVTPGAFADFSVPAYARAVSLIPRYAPGAANVLADPYPDLVMVLNQALPLVPMGTFVGATVAGGAAVPISSAEQIRVHNISGVDSIDVSVVFHLGT